MIDLDKCEVCEKPKCKIGNIVIIDQHPAVPIVLPRAVYWRWGMDDPCGKPLERIAMYQCDHNVVRHLVTDATRDCKNVVIDITDYSEGFVYPAPVYHVNDVDSYIKHFG